MEYQVVQCLPNITILEQFESILEIILLQISILLLWNDGHQCMEWILCRVVESSCLPTHFFVPHISWHDLPCHRTTKRYDDFERMVIYLLFPRKFAIRTWFCNCPQYLCLFHTVSECSPSFHDPRKMLVLTNRLLCWVVSTSDQDFVSYLPILSHPHTQIRILFHDVQRDIRNLELTPSHVSIGFSHSAFPIVVLPKDDHTDFAQEERLGLPCWTMILAICVVVDESKCLDIQILEFSIICEASSIFSWVFADTASAACPSQPDSLEMISMILAAVICNADEPCSVNTA